MRRLIVATMLVLCGAPAAQAQGTPTLAADTYIPVLNVYLARLPDIRATMKACIPDQVAASEPEEWEKARAAITATLWAANFPPEVAQSPEWLMHPDAVGVASECGETPMLGDALTAANNGWLSLVGYSFAQIGLPLITNPPTAESLAEVGTIFAEETALSAELIGCAAVSAPGILVITAVDWNGRVLEAAVRLAGAGYPRPRLVELAEAANPDLFILHEDPEAARKACDEDFDWYERYSLFQTSGLSIRINDLLERTGVTGE
jgi:hypothetical protein